MSAPMQVHRCPPLAAWLSVAQCERNARLADRTSRAPMGSELRLRGAGVRQCVGCPGVLALNAGTRDLPEVKVVVCSPKKRRKRRGAQTGLGKSIEIAAARTTPRWRCPENMTSVSALALEFRKSPLMVKRRLAQSKLEPLLGASRKIGRPALYDKAKAEEACR